MLRNKYGSNMVVKDKQDLDYLIDMAVTDVGCDYGEVLEHLINDVEDPKYSAALKYNVMKKTSWFLSYLHTNLELRSK